MQRIYPHEEKRVNPGMSEVFNACLAKGTEGFASEARFNRTDQESVTIPGPAFCQPL